LTTRDAGLVTALASKENHYQVQLPTLAEARAMLASAAGIKDEQALPPEADAVVKECDRLPLAVALCGGMVYGGTSWADLLEALRDHDLQFLSDAHPGEEQHANVWKAIDVSVRVLSEEERRRFAELAVFALDTGAPEAAVETLWEHTAGLSPRNARKLLRNFGARSLVQLDAAKGRMTLHDLVHGFATGMTSDPAALHRALLDAYRRIDEGEMMKTTKTVVDNEVCFGCPIESECSDGIKEKYLKSDVCLWRRMGAIIDDDYERVQDAQKLCKSSEANEKPTLETALGSDGKLDLGQ